MRNKLAEDEIRSLQDGSLFQGLDRQILDAMLPDLELRHWLPRQVVMTPEDMVREFCVLISGRVKITRQNFRTGRELTLSLLGAGDGFNVISLLDGKPHEVIAETLDPVTALCAPVARWQAWMDEYPAFLHAMRHYVERQMRELSELASDLALHDTMTRLSHLILHNFENQQTSHRQNLLHGLSHEELAHLIGTVRVVVNRLLRELKAEGVIDCEGGELHVLNLKKLLDKAEGHLAQSSA